MKRKKRFEIAKKATRKILKEYRNKIKAIILHGSALSEDFDKLSDIDLIVVTKRRIKEHYITFGYEKEVQDLFFSKKDYEKMLEERFPIALSSLHRYVLYGKEYIKKLKEKNFLPDERTRKRMLLNAYSALGNTLSEIDVQCNECIIKYSHHAARHALWALALKQGKFMPSNSELLAISQKKHAMLYSSILKSRKNFEKLEEIPFDEMKKIYERGFGKNKTVRNVRYAEKIIIDAWQAINKKRPERLEGIIERARNDIRKKIDSFHVYVSVDWEKEVPFYHFFFHFDDKFTSKYYDVYGKRIR